MVADIGTDNYNTKTWAFHKDVPWDIRANQDDGIDLDRDATEFVTQRLLLRRERDWASKYFGAGIWVPPSQRGVGAEHEPGDPVVELCQQRPGRRSRCCQALYQTHHGHEPERPGPGLRRVHQAEAPRRSKIEYKYVNSDVITTAMLAKLFDIDRVLGSVAYAPTNEGETAAYSFVQGRGALLAYAAHRPSPLLPSAGYTFQWKGISHGAGQTVAIQKFPIRG